ncbi:MAG: hypothetical protein IKN04_23525 [Clostridia bacterium]|nr:hypothetical protein [Clostridia bacterium]
MKKIVALLLGFVLLASVCGVSLAEASQKTVVGIAWRADTDSEFFTNVCRAVEAAGGEWVMLNQVFSADLSYDAEGRLTEGKTEINMLDETAAKYVNAIPGTAPTRRKPWET